MFGAHPYKTLFKRFCKFKHEILCNRRLMSNFRLEVYCEPRVNGGMPRVLRDISRRI